MRIAAKFGRYLSLKNRKKTMEKQEFEKLEKLVKAAKKAASSDWEKSFTKDQAARVKDYGERVMMSPKQIACLQKIVDKDDGTQEPDEDEIST